MIVIGADTHKSTHTFVALDEAARLAASSEITALPGTYPALLEWAQSLDPERIWAIEDARHVSGSLERFLAGAGERVVRVAPQLTGPSRKTQRQRGKSDAIDAQAIAAAAIAQGPGKLPRAFLDEPAAELRCLIDYRTELVKERTRLANRLRWDLHQLWPGLEISSLESKCCQRSLAQRLGGAGSSAQVVIARARHRRYRELCRELSGLEAQIAALVAQICPGLTQIPGCGPLSAAALIAQSAGTEQISSPAKLARLAGLAPLPASSGATQRHRLDRGGNRQLNAAIHRIAFTQARCHPAARTYIARKRAEGKSSREALRCLKRQLVRTIWKELPAGQRSLAKG